MISKGPRLQAVPPKVTSLKVADHKPTARDVRQTTVTRVSLIRRISRRAPRVAVLAFVTTQPVTHSKVCACMTEWITDCL